MIVVGFKLRRRRSTALAAASLFADEGDTDEGLSSDKPFAWTAPSNYSGAALAPERIRAYRP